MLHFVCVCVWPSLLPCLCAALVVWRSLVFAFSRQNTNGVNFYNILTQEPEEKLGSPAEDFICKMLAATATAQQFLIRTAHSLWWHAGWRFVRSFYSALASSAGSPSYPPPPQAITERADERSNQEETAHHPPECHLGRYSTVLQTLHSRSQKLFIVLFCFFWCFFFPPPFLYFVFPLLPILWLQVRQKKCSAKWLETSWDQWWI